MQSEETNYFRLSGDIALVTGASRGIGQAIAVALAKSGAHVILNARDAEQLDASRAELAREGLSVSALPFDVTDPAAVEAAVATIVERHGGLDIAIGNAGQSLRKPLGQFDKADMARLMDVNLSAALVLAQAVAPSMQARGGGRILFTGSMLGQIARPNNALYAATKAGLAGLVRALAVDLGPRGIRCNVVAPGVVRTAMTETLAVDPTVDAFVKQRTPLGRWATPQDIAGAALFLVSPASAFVTGQVLLVDGGMSIQA
ncbi:MAG: SDR family oxidoreductase [Chelatococcus sp.]|uniref:SDR family NAD(P)-dependent oxidoreductase n=1 Tax=Chelatococcus sp. TaxID=1953771 RepID=UPI0025BE8219|nr:glucose 1-dehydrogenase [Chelatococcus sp.]MBX3538376.1 SDR family oxidoreductase [Chelatococcus sp.]